MIVGKSLAQNNIAVFDFFAALDETLNNNLINSYDQLVDKYIENNQKKFKELLSIINEIKWSKDPLVSMFTDGASDSRKDISEGGCLYKNYGITTVALSNVVDSLLNIKRIVFDDRKFTLEEINKKRNRNFIGSEELYSEIRTKKNYGHDNEQVVALVEKILQSISGIAEKYINPLGGTVKYGLSSPGYNILSKKTPSDFSGRKAGMPYNTHISCTDAPYTEIVNFAGKLDYSNQRFNGNVVDFFISPGLVEKNTDKFIAFMQGAIISGFFQMQMNVMDSKTLLDAKANPEEYKGLIVRVWGFSAYFNELPPSYKDLLIERAIASEMVG